MEAKRAIAPGGRTLSPRAVYFTEHAKTRPPPDIFSDTHRNQPEFNVNDTLNGCTMHQVNFLSYRISKLYPCVLLYLQDSE